MLPEGTPRLTPIDIGHLHDGINHENDPRPLIDLAIDQSMPSDIRKNAAEKLNEIRGAALGFIRHCKDAELLGKLSRCQYIASDFRAFTKASIDAIKKADQAPIPADQSEDQAKLDRIAQLEKENADLVAKKARIAELERENATMKAKRGNSQGRNFSTNVEALERARNCRSITNMATVTQGMLAKGIALDDIKPGENCLTFAAWQALGRCVKRGEHGVKVATVISGSKTETNDQGETETKGFKRPWSATVFHISQTQEL